MASSREDVEAVTSLISAGADVDTNHVRHRLCSALLRAWIEGLVCAVSHCIMSVITQLDYSPLIEAAKRGSTKIVSLLVNVGAKLDLQKKVNMWH